MQLPLPARKVLIKSEYLSNYQIKDQFVEAYLLSVKTMPYRALQFTVYTEHGAIYSHLPIEAIYFSPLPPNIKHFTTEQLQPFSCLENPATIITYSLLNMACCKVTSLGNIEAYYLFTIDYCGNGLAFDPEQTKTHNIVALSTGQLAAMPNNFLRFDDNWFKIHENFPYKRQQQNYYPGG